jgi:hypothetical protein
MVSLPPSPRLMPARGIMEHLLVMMVSLPPSPRWMSARGIMDHLLVMMVSLLASPLSVGRLRLYFFI